MRRRVKHVTWLPQFFSRFFSRFVLVVVVLVVVSSVLVWLVLVVESALSGSFGVALAGEKAPSARTDSVAAAASSRVAALGCCWGTVIDQIPSARSKDTTADVAVDGCDGGVTVSHNAGRMHPDSRLPPPFSDRTD